MPNPDFRAGPAIILATLMLAGGVKITSDYIQEKREAHIKCFEDPDCRAKEAEKTRSLLDKSFGDGKWGKYFAR